MKKLTYLLALTAAIMLASCSPKLTSHVSDAVSVVQETNVSYNPLTMTLDTEPITYTIDISTRAGQVKLQGLTLQEARDLVLVEALMANKCATIFKPQYTHLVDKGKVLRITIYGFPARYKNTPDEK